MTKAEQITPADTVIAICGGHAAVAAMTHRSKTSVHRWTYSKEEGGTGGLIPASAANDLLIAARRRGHDLRPEHFFTDEWLTIETTPQEAAE